MVWWLAGCVPPEAGDSADSGGAPSLEGKVSGIDGRPLDGAVLMACASVCVVAWSDADGHYRFDGLEPGDWSIHAAADGEGSAQLVIPWQVTGSGVLDLTIPELGPPRPVPEELGEVELAEGLTVSISTSSLPGITEVRAARMPAALWPTGLDLPGPPTDGWSLAPAGAGSAIPFTAVGAGETWCTDADGLRWERCDGVLPNLGSVVWVDPG